MSSTEPASTERDAGSPTRMRAPSCVSVSAKGTLVMLTEIWLQAPGSRLQVSEARSPEPGARSLKPSPHSQFTSACVPVWSDTQQMGSGDGPQVGENGLG